MKGRISERLRRQLAAMRQPPPTGQGTPITDLVIRDLRERSRMGALKYGTELRANNGRDALRDVYEELMDACLYIRQVIEERK